MLSASLQEVKIDSIGTEDKTKQQGYAHHFLLSVEVAMVWFGKQTQGLCKAQQSNPAHRPPVPSILFGKVLDFFLSYFFVVEELAYTSVVLAYA